jgi:hypothetical protein
MIGHSWDWGFPAFSSQLVAHMRDFLYAWRDVPDLGVPSLPTEANFWALLQPFSSLNGEVLIKLLVISFAGISGVSAFVLGRYYFRLGQYPAFAMALYYMFSPALYSRIVAGHLPICFAYSLLPLYLMMLFKFFDTRRWDYAIYAGVLLGLISVHPMTFIVGLIILSIVAVTEAFWEGVTLRPVIRGVAVMAIGLALSGVWVVPMVATSLHAPTIQSRGWGLASDLGKSDPSVELSLRRPFLQSTSAPLIDAVRGVARTGMDTEFVYPPPFVSLWSLMSVVPPLLAFLSLLWRPQSRPYYSSLIIAIAGVVLTAGYHTPLGYFLYEHIFIHRPEVYAEFSNPMRFLGLTVLGYSILIGCTLQRLSVVQNRRLASFAASAALVALAVYTSPFLSGHITIPLISGSQPLSLILTPTHPEDSRVYDFLHNEPGDFRVSYLPAASLTDVGKTDLSYEWSTAFAPKPEFMSGFNNNESLTKFLTATLYQRSSQETDIAPLFGLAGVKYLVYPKYSHFTPYADFRVPDPQAALERSLRSQPRLAPVDQLRSLQTVTVYRNEAVYPHIYAASPTVVAGDFATVESLMRCHPAHFEAPAFLFSEDLPASESGAVWRLPGLETATDPDQYQDMASLAKDDVLVRPGEFVASQRDPARGWANLAYGWGHDWHYAAAVNQSGGIYTSSPSTINVPVHLSTGGRGTLYMKAHFGPEGNQLIVLVDGQEVARLTTFDSRDVGMRWAPIFESDFTVGDHALELRSQDGHEAVAALAVKRNSSHELFQGASVGREYVPEQDCGELPHVTSKVSLPLVTATKESPVRYRVAIKAARAPFVLVFAETFNADWQAFVTPAGSGSRSRLPALAALLDPIKGRRLDTHFRVNGYANAWLVDENGDSEIVIDFQRQAVMTAGLLVTGLTWMCALSSFIVAMVRSKISSGS